MALWVEMDLLTSCTVFKNQLKRLFDLSDLQVDVPQKSMLPQNIHRY